jgi:hypothetical protein
MASEVELVAAQIMGIDPSDEIERTHRADVLDWLAATDMTNLPMAASFDRAGYLITEIRLVLEALRCAEWSRNAVRSGSSIQQNMRSVHFYWKDCVSRSVVFRESGGRAKTHPLRPQPGFRPAVGRAVL